MFGYLNKDMTDNELKIWISNLFNCCYVVKEHGFEYHIFDKLYLRKKCIMSLLNKPCKIPKHHNGGTILFMSSDIKTYMYYDLKLYQELNKILREQELEKFMKKFFNEQSKYKDLEIICDKTLTLDLKMEIITKDWRN